MDSERIKLRPFELAAVRALEMAGFPLTTREVAHETNVGWKAAKRALTDLQEKKNLVISERKGNRIYWRLA